MTSQNSVETQGYGPSEAQREGATSAQHLLEISFGYVLSASLWTVAELGIADLLADGPKLISTLATASGADEDALYRILRALAMAGVFTEIKSRAFGLTPAAELLRKDHPNTQRDAVLWNADPLHYQVYAAMMHSAKTGRTALELVTGKSVFEYLMSDEVEHSRFNAAMTTMTAMMIPSVLEAYDFSPFGTVVDVGGGYGHVICEILRRHSTLRGILFEIESVVAGAERRIRQLALEGRCRTVAGDFFESVPEGADAYILKSIIHDWNDERAVKILTNCQNALRSKPRGKLLLLEQVIVPGNQPARAKLIDVEMLMWTGGRERTADEFRELLSNAGLHMRRIVPTKSPIQVIEAEPAQ